MTTIATVRRTAADRVRAKERFEKAIHDAHADGHSMREIAAAAGISHQRVYQILQGSPRA